MGSWQMWFRSGECNRADLQRRGARVSTNGSQQHRRKEARGRGRRVGHFWRSAIGHRRCSAAHHCDETPLMKADTMNGIPFQHARKRKEDSTRNCAVLRGRRVWSSSQRKSAEGGHEKPTRSCRFLRMGKLSQPQRSFVAVHKQRGTAGGVVCWRVLAAKAFATSLLEKRGTQARGGHFPSVHEVLADARREFG